MGTGKEQKIRITASGGLNDEEVDKMVKAAKEHESEDREKAELIEVRNTGDALIYSTEKSLRDYGDKLSDSEKQDIEKNIEELKKVIRSKDKAEIQKRTETLQTASYTLSEKIYQQAAAQSQEEAQPGPEPESDPAEEPQQESRSSDAVDADYEIIDDEEKDQEQEKD